MRISSVPPRTKAAAHRRPTERVRRMAPPLAEAAHTKRMFDTDAVFHAPMSALNADAW
jgi:hypothetical protein